MMLSNGAPAQRNSEIWKTTGSLAGTRKHYTRGCCEYASLVSNSSLGAVTDGKSLLVVQCWRALSFDFVLDYNVKTNEIYDTTLRDGMQGDVNFSVPTNVAWWSNSTRWGGLHRRRWPGQTP